MLELLLLMLYCTGLRPGEPLRLRMVDLDLKVRTFLIRDSKGRTRIVPFEADLARAKARAPVFNPWIENPPQSEQ
jgi:integrase/recombinase XerD